MSGLTRGIALAIVSAQICLVFAVFAATRNDPMRQLNNLLQHNPTVGRLSALDQFKPSTTRGARGSDVAARRTLLEIARAVEPAARTGDRRALRALATAQAGLGRIDEAIQTLEPFAAAAHDALIWTDLAALYLTRGDAMSDLKGLDAAARAHRLQPQVPAVGFNYSLALRALGVRSSRDGGPPAKPQKDGLAVRRQVEAHLINWARRGDVQQLREACLLAQSHTARTQDRFLVDICADANSPHASAIARGWSALADAQQQADAIQFGEARRSAETALAAFKNVSAAGLAATGYQLAVIDYQTGAFEATTRWITNLLPELERRQWSQLHARSEWLLGILDETRGHPASALGRFKAAAERLASLDEPENELTVRSLSAYMLQALGDYSGSWQAHHIVLQSAERINHLHRRQAVFLTAGLAANALGRHWAAADLLDEYVEAAHALGAPAVLAEAYLNRLGAVGSHWPKEKQLAEVRRIEAVTTEIEDQDRRSFVLARAALHEARLVPAEPALPLIARAVSHIRQSGRLFLMPEAMLRQAENQRRIGDIRAAERTLLEGIDIFHSQWTTAASTPYRVSFLDSGFLLYETLLDLLNDEKRDDEAVRWFDQARTLGNDDSGATARTPTLRELQSGLRAGTSALLFMKTRDRLRIWRIASDRIDRATSPLTSDEINALAVRWRDQASTNDSSATLETIARSLYDALIKPIGPLNPGRLVVVPDGPVHGVPFAALKDEAGRLVASITSVVLTPTIRDILPKWHPRRPRSVLTVGSPPYNEHTYGFLPHLPFAAREAMEVGTIYPDPTVLNGPAATSAAVTSGIPRADVVHFATHAVIHRDDPASSYLLVAADQSHDGRLTTPQLAAMTWDQTSLVVLAACSTAAGPGSRSQGPLGFSRALLGAGVPRVVATLWDIDDRIAHELLTAFHRRVRSGTDPIEAMREAQLSLAEQYPLGQWSAFAVYGTRLSQPTNREHTR